MVNLPLPNHCTTSTLVNGKSIIYLYIIRIGKPLLANKGINIKFFLSGFLDNFYKDKQGPKTITFSFLMMR